MRPMIFCHHKWSEYWQTYYSSTDVIFRKECPKCGKRQEFRMPADNVKPAYEHYMKLKKQMKI